MKFSIKETNSIYLPFYGLWVDGKLIAMNDSYRNLVILVDKLIHCDYTR